MSSTIRPSVFTASGFYELLLSLAVFFVGTRMFQHLLADPTITQNHFVAGTAYLALGGIWFFTATRFVIGERLHVGMIFRLVVLALVIPLCWIVLVFFLTPTTEQLMNSLVIGLALILSSLPFLWLANLFFFRRLEITSKDILVHSFLSTQAMDRDDADTSALVYHPFFFGPLFDFKHYHEVGSVLLTIGAKRKHAFDEHLGRGWDLKALKHFLEEHGIPCDIETMRP